MYSIPVSIFFIKICKSNIRPTAVRAGSSWWGARGPNPWWGALKPNVRSKLPV